MSAVGRGSARRRAPGGRGGDASPTLDDAVRAYKATMLPRSAAMSTLTADGPEDLISVHGDAVHGPGGVAADAR
jgi:hypothetical protein